DHGDAHRSPAFIVGPYVKHTALVSTPYTTLNFLRTMGRILGLAPMHLTDGFAQPMADLFDITQPPPSSPWYTATVPAILYNSTLPLPQPPPANVPPTTQTAAYWRDGLKRIEFTD